MAFHFFSHNQDIATLPKNNLVVYLGGSHLERARVKQSCYDNGLEFYLPAEEFSSSVDQCENDILSIIANISPLFKDLSWAFPVSTASTANVELHRRLIHLDVLLKMIQTDNQDISFVFEDFQMLLFTKKYFNKTATSKEKMISIVLEIKRELILIKRILKYLTVSMQCWFFSRLLRFKTYNDAQSWVIRSWFSQEGMRNNQYLDRNFGQLPDLLKEKNVTLYFSPLFFNIEHSIFHILKHLKNLEEKIIISERQLSLISFFKIAFRALRSYRISKKIILFKEIDIYPLVKISHKETAFRLNELQTLNFVESLKRSFHEQEFKLLYSMENNGIEKVLINEVRKQKLSCKTIGYQHSVWYKDQIGMKVPTEAPDYPQPDHIITSGKVYKKILTECGFSASRITNGPSLRFSYVRKYATEKFQKDGMYLVVLNYDLDQNIEMLDHVIEVANILDISIAIKSHPVISKKQLNNYFNQKSFNRFNYVDGPVPELVKKSFIVFMPASSVSNLEVLAMGVPLIRIKLGTNFNFDPIWTQLPYPSFFKSSKSIVNFIQELKNGTYSSELYETSEEIKDNYFTLIDESTMKVFREL